MRYFEDIPEIEHVMDILRDDIKAGVLGDSIGILNKIALMLKTYVKNFKDKDESWLFSQCQSCSDTLHHRSFCKYEETRGAMEALSTLLFLKEGMETAVPEDQESQFSQVAELEERLKKVLLFKYQGPGIRASEKGTALRRKRKVHNKKKEGIFAFACHCVKIEGVDVTPQQCWDLLGDEEWRCRDKNGNEVAVWTSGDIIRQSVSGREAGEIKQNSFRKYLTDARKV